MASYIIEINEGSEKAKHFIEFLKDYTKDNSFVQLANTPNITTRKAITDARKGKTYKADSVKALFDSI